MQNPQNRPSFFQILLDFNQLLDIDTDPEIIAQSSNPLEGINQVIATVFVEHLEGYLTIKSSNWKIEVYRKRYFRVKYNGK